LISGRTAKQGIGLEIGKLSKSYAESVNHVQLSTDDVKELALEKTHNLRISTEHGSVTVNWIIDKGLSAGMVFFPYGPWANQVFSSNTDSTGMPIMKGIPATIIPTDDKVQELDEIIEKIRSGA